MTTRPVVEIMGTRFVLIPEDELGLTQTELAKLAGIRQETLSRLEFGKHKPNVRTVERIEAALRRKRGKKS